MRRLKIIMVTLAVVAIAVETAFAQHRKDRVLFKDKRAISGRVLRETWKTVELDRDGDGVAEKVYSSDKVDSVKYGNRPRYMVEAILLRRKPKEYIAKLSRAYVDDSTPKRILQHAYYDVAATYTGLAATDGRMLRSAVEAYERLFREIPDTCYAVTGRIELGNRLLALGKGDEAIRQFKALRDGRFGPNVALRGKLMIARVELTLRRFERAERLLRELAGSRDVKDAGLSQEIKLLRSRSLIEQGKFKEAHSGIDGVLSEKPSKNILGMAYCVLGDLFAKQARHKTAVTAYLKVLLMYPEADAPEKALAHRQAKRMFEKLGRTKDAKALRKELLE